uniref:VWFA domain-containing protein n=1 Tax=Romanomermis culicivorax TaxID=13658 RepID=A0A915HGP7_ROMCU
MLNPSTKATNCSELRRNTKKSKLNKFQTTKYPTRMTSMGLEEKALSARSKKGNSRTIATVEESRHTEQRNSRKIATVGESELWENQDGRRIEIERFPSLYRIDQYSNGGRSDAKKIFVLMTDGNSINPWKVVMQTAHRLQDTKANVYVLGLGDNLYYPELNLYTGSGSLITRLVENLIFN